MAGLTRVLGESRAKRRERPPIRPIIRLSPIVSSLTKTGTGPTGEAALTAKVRLSRRGLSRLIRIGMEPQGAANAQGQSEAGYHE